jgi:hypothetical protein
VGWKEVRKIATVDCLVSSVRSRAEKKPYLYPVVGPLLSPPSTFSVVIYKLGKSESWWLSEARALSGTAAMSATAPQQINVADLELPQLGEVKKQLEEACFF